MFHVKRLRDAYLVISSLFCAMDRDVIGMREARALAFEWSSGGVGACTPHAVPPKKNFVVLTYQIRKGICDVRGRETVTRQPHKLETAGAIPASATKRLS